MVTGEKGDSVICSDCMVSTALRDFVLGLGSMEPCSHCGKEGTVVNEVNLNEHIEALFEDILVPFDALPKMTQVEIECGADHGNPPIFSGALK